MRDSEIEQWVINEIKLMTDGQLSELCVFSLHGVVNLRGTVRSRADKLLAQQAAARAKGVVEVINQLNLRRRNQARRRASVKNQVVPAAAAFHLHQNNPASSSHLAS